MSTQQDSLKSVSIWRKARFDKDKQSLLMESLPLLEVIVPGIFPGSLQTNFPLKESLKPSPKSKESVNFASNKSLNFDLSSKTYLSSAMNLLQRTLFFQFIQIALDKRSAFDRTPTESEWEMMYKEGVRHTICGVLYPAIEKLPAEQRPPKKLLLQWYMLSEKIKASNQRLNREVLQVITQLQTLGWECVLLKGQGLATNYKQQLLRIPGDIDLWVRPINNTAQQLQTIRKALAKMVSQFGEVKGVTYCHMQINLLQQTAVELHVTPSWLCCPWINLQLQSFFSKNADLQFQHTIDFPENIGRVTTPTPAFNRIYLLLHLFRHLYCSGFGLRQLMDYFLVLKQPRSEAEKEHDCLILKVLKLERFAGGIMYAMQQVFDLQKEQMLCPVNIKEGEFILNELLQARNMGFYDKRICWKNKRVGSVRNYVQSIFRNIHFLQHYPLETLCDPYFRARFFLVRKMNGWE